MLEYYILLVPVDLAAPPAATPSIVITLENAIYISL